MALLLGLPHECLVHVMRQLAGEPRSQLAAARACSRLRRAAAAALDSVVVKRRLIRLTAAQRDSLQCYLGQHGQQVTSISLTSPFGDPSLELALPAACRRLRALSVSHVRLHLGVLQTATGLTALALEYCDVLDDVASVAAALGALRGLRELEWRDSTLPGRAALPGCWLSSLVQLTRLQLRSTYRFAVQDDTLQHLGCLTNLLELDAHGSDVTAAPFTGLQQLQQLTSLRLSGLRELCVGSGSIAAISSGLTGLQQLRVQECGGFEPACLAGVSQLQVLQLSGTPVAGGPDGVAVFLAQLAGLQQLQELRLDSTLGHWAPAAAAYCGLTASSHLTLLELHECQLPEGECNGPKGNVKGPYSF
jgi:hypothetical protein